MQKLAFVTSFLAVFITMDNQLFDGAVTRYSWGFVNDTAREAGTKISIWARRH